MQISKADTDLFSGTYGPQLTNWYFYLLLFAFMLLQKFQVANME